MKQLSRNLQPSPKHIQAGGSDLNGAFEQIGAVETVFGCERRNTFHEILKGAEVAAANFCFELSVPRMVLKPKC